jgi:hypothetical protein
MVTGVTDLVVAPAHVASGEMEPRSPTRSVRPDLVALRLPPAAMLVVAGASGEPRGQGWAGVVSMTTWMPSWPLSTRRSR